MNMPTIVEKGGFLELLVKENEALNRERRYGDMIIDFQQRGIPENLMNGAINERDKALRDLWNIRGQMQIYLNHILGGYYDEDA